jgi:CheY-like chemotaxis protein
VSRRLLLVDDAKEIRAIACLSLERVGDWTVAAVDSGPVALAAVDRDGPFDAVLLDVMMPGMDGPSTLVALRAAGLALAIPIVFLTAKAQSADRQRLLALGAAGVIGKPFDPFTLPSELDALLGA